MVMRLTTVLCWVRSFKNRCWANRWNNDGAVRLIMCSRRTAVSTRKDDGSKICFKCDPRLTNTVGGNWFDQLGQRSRKTPAKRSPYGQKIQAVEKTVSCHSRRSLAGRRWLRFLGQSIANRPAWRTNGLGAHPGRRHGDDGPGAAGAE